METLKYLIS